MLIRPIHILFIVAMLSMGCLSTADQTVTTTPPQPIETPAIAIITLPDEIEAGDQIEIRWGVTGPGQRATHTAIHYGSESRSGVLGTGDGPGAAGYPSLTTEFASGDFPLSREFTTIITPDEEGTIFLRAHVIVDGKNYWTDEVSVDVKGNNHGGILQ